MIHQNMVKICDIFQYSSEEILRFATNGTKGWLNSSVSKKSNSMPVHLNRFQSWYRVTP